MTMETVLHHDGLTGGVIGVACLSLACLASTACAQSETMAKLATTDDSKVLTIRSGDQVVAAYQYGGDIFKPYVKSLFLPDGRNVLRDSPWDHKHHHGLMFAWNVDGVEFWGEAGPVGRQLHRRFIDKSSEARRPGVATISEALDWVGKDGKTILLKEQRKIDVRAAASGVDRLVTWQSDFVGADAKRDVTISGREYLGLGLRFPVPMDKGAHFMTAGGKTAVKDVNGSQSVWCAITGNAAPGQPITLAVFDDPANPRPSCKWFAMNTPFAYISATIGLKGKPFVLKAGEHVVVRYGVAVWSKPVQVAQVNAAYKAWRDLLRDRP